MQIEANKALPDRKDLGETLKYPILGDPLKIYDPEGKGGPGLSRDMYGTAAGAINWAATSVVRPFATPFYAAMGLAKKGKAKGGIFLGALGAVGGFTFGAVMGAVGTVADVVKTGFYSVAFLGFSTYHGVETLYEAMPEEGEGAKEGARALTAEAKVQN